MNADTKNKTITIHNQGVPQKMVFRKVVENFAIL